MKICEWCNSPFEGKNRFCSIKCKNTYISNLSSSRKARKKNMEKLNKTEEQKIRVSNRMKGNSNTTGYKWKEEDKAKLLSSIKKSWKDPERIKKHIIPDSGNYKSGNYFSKKTNSDHHYRSSYEFKLLQILESNMYVESFISEPFPIKYVEEGNDRNYIPDFLIKLISGLEILVEVKPKKFVSTLKLKKIAAKEYCQENNIADYLIFTENEINDAKKAAIAFAKYVS